MLLKLYFSYSDVSKVVEVSWEQEGQKEDGTVVQAGSDCHGLHGPQWC